MSGTTPKRSVAPPGAIVSPVFTSSNVSSAPCAWSRSASACEVARRRRDDADVHHHRLDDHPGDLAGMVEQDAPHGVEAAERHDVGRARRATGDDRDVLGHRARPVGRPGVGGVGVDRDLHRVVVAVVAALDLDDALAPGGGPHQVDGGHRGLGAGVGEAPQRQAEAAGELAGDGDDVGHRLGEVGAERRRGRLTAATIAGWAWPAIIVPKPACRSTYSLPSTSHTREPAPRLDEHRARRGVLPRRRDAARRGGATRVDVQLRASGAVRASSAASCSRDQRVEGVEAGRCAGWRAPWTSTSCADASAH